MDVFNLSAKLTLDDKEYKAGLNNAESQGEKSGNSILSKFGSLASGVGKVLAGAVTAASTAVVKIVKDSVDAYANYEQLVGGVQKLFGTAGMGLEDYAKSQGKTVDEVKGQWESLKASEDTVMANASEAFKTAGMSANEYMETVTGFSAALIGSLGGDTQAAAEKADIALRAMSDNANTFGTDMEAISNAYAGFSKQNYTMLDNLKLGYGGTKQEMERLLADAEAYMATQGELRDLSIDSYADIVDAIQAVQEKQGIAGTTAREAATTIEGSLSMTKAAWENLITGLGDSEADISSLITDLVDSAGMAFENILPVVEQALTGVGTLIEELLPVAIDKLPEIINEVLPQLLESGVNIVTTLVNGIVSNLPMLLENASTIINLFIEAVLTNLPTIITALAGALPQIITTITDILVNNIPLLLDTAILLFMAIVEAIPSIIVALVENVPRIVETIYEYIVKLLPKLTEFVGDLVSKVLEWGKNFVKLGGDAAKNFFDTVVNFIKNLPYNIGVFLGEIITKVILWVAQMAVKAEEAGRKFIDNVVNFIKNLPDKINEFLTQTIPKLAQWVIDMGAKGLEAIQSLIQNVIDGAKEIPKKMAEIGENIVKGVWEGIKAMASWFSDQISSFFSGIVDGAKDALGIASPSKVFRDSVGKWIPEGIAVGIDTNADDVYKSLENLRDKAVSINDYEMGGFESYLEANGATRGVPSINQTINITTTDNSPDVIARKIRLESRYGLMTGGVAYA